MANHRPSFQQKPSMMGGEPGAMVDVVCSSSAAIDWDDVDVQLVLKTPIIKVIPIAQNSDYRWRSNVYTKETVLHIFNDSSRKYMSKGERHTISETQSYACFQQTAPLLQ
jgi:hypothetical protein